MNKTTLFFLLLVALALGAWLVTTINDSGTLADKEKAFAVEDTAGIHKIFMVNMDKQSIKLERTKDGWIVNDKYKARPDGMELLLRTIKNVRVDYPVPKKQKEPIMKLLASNATKVEIYNEDNERIKTYYVGHATNDVKGTYMIMENAENPYVTTVPAFQGSLETRYHLIESEWRDRTVFDYRPGEIQSVSVEYPGKPQYSFKITRPEEGVLKITPLQDDNPYKNGKQNTFFVSRYLTFFQNLNAEGYEVKYEKKDSVLNSTPFVVFTIRDKNNEANTVKMFYKPVTRKTKLQFDEAGNPVPHDVDRYFALINDGRDFVMIQQFNFGKLFRYYPEFLEKPLKEKPLKKDPA